MPTCPPRVSRAKSNVINIRFFYEYILNIMSIREDFKFDKANSVWGRQRVAAKMLLIGFRAQRYVATRRGLSTVREIQAAPPTWSP